MCVCVCVCVCLLQDTTNNVEGQREIQRNRQHTEWLPYYFSKS